MQRQHRSDRKCLRRWNHIIWRITVILPVNTALQERQKRQWKMPERWLRILLVQQQQRFILPVAEVSLITGCSKVWQRHTAPRESTSSPPRSSIMRSCIPVSTSRSMAMRWLILMWMRKVLCHRKRSRRRSVRIRSWSVLCLPIMRSERSSRSRRSERLHISMIFCSIQMRYRHMHMYRSMCRRWTLTC